MQLSPYLLYALILLLTMYFLILFIQDLNKICNSIICIKIREKRDNQSKISGIQSYAYKMYDYCVRRFTRLDVQLSVCKNQTKWEKSETCMSKPH